MVESLLERQPVGTHGVRWTGARRSRLTGVVAGVAACALMAAAPAMASPVPTIITHFAGTGSSAAATPGPAASSSVGEDDSAAVDSAGNLYVGDYENGAVYKITPDGTLSLFAGTPGSYGAATPGPATSSSLDDVNSLAVDSHDNLYIADGGNYQVYKVTPGGTLSIVAGDAADSAPVPGPAISSPLGEVYGVAVDPSGNVYIADYSNDEIEKVTPSGTLSVFAGDGSSGSPVPGPATSSEFDEPDGVATDASGNVYVADYDNSLVEKITPSGTLSIFAGNGSSGQPTPGPATSSAVGGPDGLAVDPAGDLLIADYYDSVIERVTPSGTLSVAAGNGTNATPTYGGAPTSSALSNPEGVAVNSAGTLFVADEGNSVVERVGLATPGAPVDVALAAQDGSAALSFEAPIDPGTSAVTSYQVSLDGGSTWQTITPSDSSGTLSTTLTGLTDGTTYNVLVRAVNTSGFGSDSPSASVTPAAPTTTATTPTTTTTTTTPPATTSTTSTTSTTATTPTSTAPSSPTTTAGAGEGVSLSAQAARAGVAVSGTGAVQLALVCPQTAAGCDADGLLTLALSTASSHALIADARAPVKNSVLARFAGVEIQTGQSRLVSIKLTPVAMRYLQTSAIRRVLVTLTIHNHLAGGPVVTTTQRVWLNVAALRTACPAAVGSLTSTSIAQMRLGLTRRQAHRLGRYRKAGYGFERYCLTGGAIRVRYPAGKLLGMLSAAQRHQNSGRIYLALTANQHYAIGRVHTGMTVAAARTRLPLGAGVTVGKNTWYLVVTTKGAWVLKAQHGVIGEIGITARSLTSTRQARQRLLHNL